MNKKSFISIFCGGLIFAALFAAYKYNYVSGTWRYRITVEIETPEGVKTGSAVREVSNSASRHKLIDLPEAGNPAEFRGEAVIVDLGKRGTVFATLGVSPYREFYAAFPVSGASTVYGIEYFNQIPIGKTVHLLPEDYPQFVTFTDMNDPKSVKLVRGSKFNPGKQDYDQIDDFEALFGKGVRVKSVTFERTDDPVNFGNVDQYLSWLHNFHDHLLDGRKFHTVSAENELANSLGAGSFTTKRDLK